MINTFDMSSDLRIFLAWHEDPDKTKKDLEKLDKIYAIFKAAGSPDGEDVDKSFTRLSRSDREKVMKIIRDGSTKYYDDTLFDELGTLKEALFDAPTDVKSSFNTLVEYFAFAGVKGALKGVKANYKISKLQDKIKSLFLKRRAKQDEIREIDDEVKEINGKIRDIKSQIK